jgi:uncharacterized protein YndB with AHSA1/START domain
MSNHLISRVIRAPREAVYCACSEPRELARWRFPLDMTARLLNADDSGYRMTLGYEDGRADTFHSAFVARVPNERVVERIRFDAPERAGAMMVTTALRDVADGTEVSLRFEGLPASIRLEDNEEGTRQALGRLAELVEVRRANIERRPGACR